jgi:hypothetical protein
MLLILVLLSQGCATRIKVSPAEADWPVPRKLVMPALDYTPTSTGMTVISTPEEEVLNPMGGVGFTKQAWDLWKEWLTGVLRRYEAARETICRVNTGKPCPD